MGLVHRFIRWCPGAIGYVLRRRYYKNYLGYCGSKVIFGRFINFEQPDNIRVEDNAIISNSVTIIAHNGSSQSRQVQIEKNVFIGTFSTLKALNGGRIVLREGANISSTCSIQSDSLVEIGKDTLLAAFCNIGMKSENTGENSLNIHESTRIGNGCWLGSRVQQTAGTTIGNDSIIGAHAHVISDVPDFGIAVGQPAKVVKSRKASASK